MRIPFLGPGDAARRLGLSVSRITQLDREGKLPALATEFAREREQRRAATSSPEGATSTHNADRRHHRVRRRRHHGRQAYRPPPAGTVAERDRPPSRSPPL